LSLVTRHLSLLWRLIALLLISPHSAHSEETLTLVLNWVPDAEHALFFYAKQQGWYRDAGIALTIDYVAGSPAAIQRAAQQPRTLATSDFVAFLREYDKGVAVSAVMVLQPLSPYAIYSAEESGIRAMPDLAGKKVGAQPQDPMRQLFSVLATRNGLQPSTVIWLDRSNAAKPDALANGEIDAALNPFLHNHLNYEATLGTRTRVLWWSDLGFPAYGHVLVANTSLLEQSGDVLRRFVAVTQRAWQQCSDKPPPCLDALLADHPNLDRSHEEALWKLAAARSAKSISVDAPIGAFDSTRVQRTLDDVRAAFPRTASPALNDPTTNAFIDRTLEARPSSQ
jgi:NitT/TauT family transport system substrate-binding protein